MEDKHLNNEQICNCAEAIRNGTFHLMDDNIHDHLAECDKCANEVNKISTIIEEEQALLVIENAKKKKA